MVNLPLKFIGYTITFQEVPNEVSLSINISNCPYKCRGCHSEYLWDYDGEFLLDNIENIINGYKDLITCVCFMGGDQNKDELLRAINICKSYNLKTCLYTGNDDINMFSDLINTLDYIKIGRYDESLGGLDSKITNQNFYKITDNELINMNDWFKKKGRRC